MNKNHTAFLHSLFGEVGEPKRRIFRSIKAKAAAKRNIGEKIADSITSAFGSITFLVINILIFVFWIVFNTGVIKGLKIIDPFPFNFLTMVVSLEAIVLSVFVLISQNRESKVDDLREETHLQLNLISEKEITKLIKMTALLLEKHGVDLSQDSELHKMIRPVSEEEIEKRLEKEIL
jgi:uncharacterized membrane protein